MAFLRLSGGCSGCRSGWDFRVPFWVSFWMPFWMPSPEKGQQERRPLSNDRIRSLHSVPQEPVLRTEYLFRTGEACFLHRMLQKTLRVPQEAVLRTECQFRTVGGRFRYRMPPRQKGEEHCCTEFLKLPEKRRPKILSNEPHLSSRAASFILLCLSLDETISSNLSKTQKISKS